MTLTVGQVKQRAKNRGQSVTAAEARRRVAQSMRDTRASGSGSVRQQTKARGVAPSVRGGAKPITGCVRMTMPGATVGYEEVLNDIQGPKKTFSVTTSYSVDISDTGTKVGQLGSTGVQISDAADPSFQVSPTMNVTHEAGGQSFLRGNAWTGLNFLSFIGTKATKSDPFFSQKIPVEQVTLDDACGGTKGWYRGQFETMSMPHYTLQNNKLYGSPVFRVVDVELKADGFTFMMGEASEQAAVAQYVNSTTYKNRVKAMASSQKVGDLVTAYSGQDWRIRCQPPSRQSNAQLHTMLTVTMKVDAVYTEMYPSLTGIPMIKVYAKQTSAPVLETGVVEGLERLVLTDVKPRGLEPFMRKARDRENVFFVDSVDVTTNRFKLIPQGNTELTDDDVVVVRDRFVVGKLKIEGTNFYLETPSLPMHCLIELESVYDLAPSPNSHIGVGCPIYYATGIAVGIATAGAAFVTMPLTIGTATAVKMLRLHGLRCLRRETIDRVVETLEEVASLDRNAISDRMDMARASTEPATVTNIDTLKTTPSLMGKPQEQMIKETFGVRLRKWGSGDGKRPLPSEDEADRSGSSGTGDDDAKPEEEERLLPEREKENDTWKKVDELIPEITQEAMGESMVAGMGVYAGAGGALATLCIPLAVIGAGIAGACMIYSATGAIKRALEPTKVKPVSITVCPLNKSHDDHDADMELKDADHHDNNVLSIALREGMLYIDGGYVTLKEATFASWMLGYAPIPDFVVDHVRSVTGGRRRGGSA